MPFAMANSFQTIHSQAANPRQPGGNSDAYSPDPNPYVSADDSRRTALPLRTMMVFVLVFVLHPFSGVWGEAGLKKVSFMPQWIPQAQFAGYLVALDKGFYRDAGLDVHLLTGGPGKDCFLSLTAGEITFCTGWLSTAIEKRASGLPVVNLAQIVQHSALLLVAMKDSGIREPKDLNGKSVGFWVGSFDVSAMVFFKKYDLNVRLIPNYTTVTIFLKGAVDAVGAMWYNEYHTILDSGYNPDEVTVFHLADLGVDFPEDGLYCMEETFLADPQKCTAFVDASLKGWLYAFDHEDEAVEIVMKYANAAYTGTNRAHQRWMLQRMKDLIVPHGVTASFGKLRYEDYMKVGNALKDLYLVYSVPKYDQFYRGRK